MESKEDKILSMFFEEERWLYAIEKGIDKDIRKDQLKRLTTPQERAKLYLAIRDHKYAISPPHTAKIPKDKPGEFRTVYVNEPYDRVFLSIANDLLFEICPEMVHPRCKSYQKGIGCGKVVKEVVSQMRIARGDEIGWKSDLSKYFDSVPLRYIDGVFDQIERKHGKSAVIDVLRGYYHSDWYFDEKNNLCSGYQSLKQGCAVAAFLADAILYHVDDKLANDYGGYYIRYSDDMLYIGGRYREAMQCLSDELAQMEMKLNPKKVEFLARDRWFKFLGYSIKGESISLSSTRIKTFQKEIECRTIKARHSSYEKSLHSVINYLYKGFGEFSWATQILPVVNVTEDIDTLNAFVMDALRAAKTGKRKIGGLGYVVNQKVGCIMRGKGRNVRSNKEKTDDKINGYITIGCAFKALHTSREAFNTLVASL